MAEYQCMCAEGFPERCPCRKFDVSEHTTPADARIAALSRAQEALMAINGSERLNHYCDEWIEKNADGEDDGCEICWGIAIDVDRALRGATVCGRCRGTGMPGPEGDACDECGGSGEFELTVADETHA